MDTLLFLENGMGRGVQNLIFYRGYNLFYTPYVLFNVKKKAPVLYWSFPILFSLCFLQGQRPFYDKQDTEC